MLMHNMDTELNTNAFHLHYTRGLSSNEKHVSMFKTGYTPGHEIRFMSVGIDALSTSTILTQGLVL